MSPESKLDMPVAEDGVVAGPVADPAATGPETDRQFVVALARGLDVLSCFQAGDRMLSNKEIAARTGLAKSTVSRLTYTLTQLGYLKAVEDLGRYRIGPSVLGLGYVALANMKVRELARPLMQDLAEYANGLVSMAVRDRAMMIYVENCRARNTGTLRVNVGMHMPIPSTSIGRAFLAGLPEAERAFLLDQLKAKAEAAAKDAKDGKDGAKDGNDWPAQQAAIEQSLRDYAERGYCLSIGEWQKDTNAVAVPLVLPGDGDVISFSVSGPSFALSRRQLEDDLGPRLLYMVKNIEAMLRNVS